MSIAEVRAKYGATLSSAGINAVFDEIEAGGGQATVISDMVKVDGYATQLTLNGVVKTVVRDSNGIVIGVV